MRFPRLAARLAAGMRLADALASVPGFLEPRFNALLRLGLDAGDPTAAVQACAHRRMDARSQVLGGVNYAMLLLLAVGPAAMTVFSVLMVFVMPKYVAILHELETPIPALTLWLIANAHMLLVIMSIPTLLVFLAAALYLDGPRLSRWLRCAWTDRLVWLLPWKRERLRRDFLTALCSLLDSGVPEPRAVLLAGDACIHATIQARSRLAARDLEQGRTLAVALRRIDGAREFEWRLENAGRGPGGFSRSLRGWLEALEARAFGLEQLASQLTTTGLVLWFGLIVGVVAAGFFQPLIAVIETAALW
jgi:type II secretory pathway component PulF